jgi:quercetin dioxygenase-like cupin family protein
MAVVSGDPSKSGPFTVQLAFPDGYRIQPHTHPTDEQVTVVNGTFLVGMGAAWNGGAMKPMTAGASGTTPAGMAHFAEAKGKTYVQVVSTGPFAMAYVNPADDPSARRAP